jgi:DNA-binding transcriptional regulator YhcF (GntR family)
MKKIDRLLREILHRHHEHGDRFFSQKNLAEVCSLSLGTVNPIITRLEQIGAVERKPLGFRLIDPKRAILYWAVTRDLPKDIKYATFVPKKVEEVETDLPSGSILTAYSGFRAKFGATPADYSQVFVYADPEVIRRAYKPTQRKKYNLFVLALDDHLKGLSSGNVAPLVQIYVDLWQLGASASRFVEDMEKKLALAPTKALEEVATALRRET